MNKQILCEWRVVAKCLVFAAYLGLLACPASAQPFAAAETPPPRAEAQTEAEHSAQTAPIQQAAPVEQTKAEGAQPHTPNQGAGDVQGAAAQKAWQKPTEFVTVQQGDTAYALAHAHGLEVAELLAINGLSSHDLEVGQVLRVLTLAPYQVSRGDTIYSLAQQNGVSVEDLLTVNGLEEDGHIEVGQWIIFPSNLPETHAPTAPAFSAVADGVGHTPQPEWPRELGVQLPESQGWRGHALALLGTPYVYGGTTERGLDCSAFVQRVFQPLGVKLPRTSAAQAGVGVPVSRHALRSGDLLFFDTVGNGRVTHVGIYLGNGEFVNANSYLGEVAIDELGSHYWKPRYLTARRILSTDVQAQASARSNP